MVTPKDIHSLALGLPKVTEHSHFNLPAYRVGDKTFVVIQKGATHSILSVSKEEANKQATNKPSTYEEVWRSEKIFVGLRVDLSKAELSDVKELIKSAWSNKAPKHLSSKLSHP